MNITFKESLEILKKDYKFINYDNNEIIKLLEFHWCNKNDRIIKSRIYRFYKNIFKYKNSSNINFWIERGFPLDYCQKKVNEINEKRSLSLKKIKKDKKTDFLSYDDCKKFVIENNIKTKYEYLNYKKPKNVPSDPYNFYIDVWENWTKFLIGKNSRNSINYYNYIECKEQIKKYNIKSKNDWFKNIKFIISDDDKIPYDPFKVYDDFKWGDFLGTNKIQDNQIKFLNYNETKEFVQKLNLKSSKEWKLYCKSKPYNITSKPYKKFKEFKSFSDFLGYEPCKSLGEKLIEEYLIKNKISYISQKRFDDCKNIRTLPFDFYLTEKNICIEFDGPQHEKLSNYFNMSEQDFYKLKVNDTIKNNFCLENNIKLIRIKYENINNIDNILNNIF